MPRGEQKRIVTPGYNKRRNTFITLLWPRKRSGLIFNTYAKRRSREYKLHLSNVLQHAKRRGAKKVILFADHAPCHKTKKVRRFIREHRLILKVKFLPKRAPNLNPVERLVNKPLKSAVCTNRSYSNIDDVIRMGRMFLTKYKRTYGA